MKSLKLLVLIYYYKKLYFFDISKQQSSQLELKIAVTEAGGACAAFHTECICRET